ncbi:hypothetical protein AZE42_03970 [Rhizopogon vesiculosus]|uniref:Uncharacterized protein n=1 Tax=Rhizopogon vesiculosus TaxID=180088 RepID=A0A1J8PWE8_9AGAM|nr:hypothetical protein AZE42_03970 [Rhizopogon vesiculosus]
MVSVVGPTERIVSEGNGRPRVTVPVSPHAHDQRWWMPSSVCHFSIFPVNIQSSVSVGTFKLKEVIKEKKPEINCTVNLISVWKNETSSTDDESLFDLTGDARRAPIPGAYRLNGWQQLRPGSVFTMTNTPGEQRVQVLIDANGTY